MLRLEDRHDHQERNVPRANTEWYHKSFTFRGIQEWNSLPSELRTLKSSVVFRTKLRTYMFNRSFEDICVVLFLCTYWTVVCLCTLQELPGRPANWLKRHFLCQITNSCREIRISRCNGCKRQIHRGDDRKLLLPPDNLVLRQMEFVIFQNRNTGIFN